MPLSRLLNFLSVLVLFGLPDLAEGASRCFYSYYHAEGGGGGEMIIEAEAGRILSHRSIFDSPGNPMIEGVASDETGEFFVVANRHKEARSCYMLRLLEGQPLLAAWRVELPQRADHHLVRAGRAVILGHQGSVFRLDADRPGVVSGAVDLKRALEIHDSALAGAAFSPDGARIVVLVAEDSPDGRREGGRLVVLRWPSLAVVHSISLPRSHPELHYPSGSRERNPMPVAIQLFPESNTAALALNLYGAVAFTDLDALLDGRLENYSELPTSRDESFGAGYPTALFPVEVAGRQLVLADNSGGEGGMAVFDPASRKRLAWLDTGKTSIGFFQMVDANRGVGNRSGVISSRGQDATQTSHSEQNDLIVIDFSPLTNGHLPQHEIIALEDYVYFSSPIGLANPARKILLGLFGFDRKTLTCAIYDIDARRIMDRQPALGVIRGFLEQ